MYLVTFNGTHTLRRARVHAQPHARVGVSRVDVMWVYLQNGLMQESEAETLRREEMVRMYHGTKEALRVIGDIDATTMSTPLPPPVDTDDFDRHVPSPQPSRRPVSMGSGPAPPSRPSRPVPGVPSRPDNAPSIPR